MNPGALSGGTRIRCVSVSRIDAELIVSSPTDSHISPLASPHAKSMRASIFSGSGTGQSIELRRAVTLVGSRQGCKITLRHPDISPVHCAIINTGEEVYLRDLVSKAGTYLNGLPAECEKLSDGDIIRVGEWEVAVELHAAAAHDPTGSSGINLEPTPTVLALKNNNSGPLVKLRREISVIGRKSGGDFVVHDKQVSRAHALVFLLNGRPVICDLLSENGLMINDEPSRFSMIRSGDTLVLGSAKVRVVIPSPTVQATNEDGSDVRTAETVAKPPDDQSDMIDIRASELRRD